MSNANWINELKAGDKVIVSGKNGRSIRTVEKVTATQIVIKITDAYSQKFRKTTGSEIGGGTYDSDQISEAMPEKIDEIRKAVRRHNLPTLVQRQIKDLTDDQIARIVAILSEGK